MARLIFTMLLLWAALAVALAGSHGTLTGRVVDDEGKPIIGATIRLEGSALGGLSKAPDGRFRIIGIAAGDYVAVINSLGVKEPARRSVRIFADRVSDLGTIALTTGTIGGKEAVVTGAPPVDREQVTTTRSISPDGMSQRIAGSSSRTSVVDAVALQSAPAASGEKGVKVRGGRSSETSIRVDGVEVSDPYTGGYGATAAAIYPSVSSLAVQEVNIAANPVSAEYGDVVSGVVNARVMPNGTTVITPNAQFTQKTRSQAADSIGTIARVEDRSAERYAKIYENPFLAAHVSPISTFSIDVDRASYSNVRRYLRAGALPPADAVRIEELVNYFDYFYPDPDDEHPFRILTEMTDCPWDRSHRLVRIGLQGRRVNSDVLPPSNLTFLIDVSGSMQGADRLELIKQGFRLLVEQLRPEDNVAIVVYAGAAGLVLPMTPGSEKETILDAIDDLSAGGSTAGGAGINLAYQIAKENFSEGGNNRVILATDGDFNVGVSSDAELVTLIEEKRRDGIFLTVLGVGTGNYQDAKMEQLADKGNGNYSYLDNLDEARKAFVDELAGTLLTIAKDVKIQVHFAPERVESYRLIGYENRMLATEDFDNDAKDAGELGAGHTVTAIYEVVPRGARTASLDGWVGRPDTLDMPGDWQPDELMRVRLRYKLPDADVSTLIEGPVIDRGVSIERASEDFRFAAAVAQFGMLLRGSQHKGSSTFDDVLRLATASKGVDRLGYRAELIDLVKAAQRIPATAAR